MNTDIKKEEVKPYCPDCGNVENLKYNEQYANGEYWTCKECGENFFFINKGENG